MLCKLLPRPEISSTSFLVKKNYPVIGLTEGKLTNDIRLLPAGLQGFQSVLPGFPGDDGDHANAEVEYPPHFFGTDLTLLLQPLKQRRDLPTLGVDVGAQLGGQGARQVFSEATAGNVSESMNADDLTQILDCLHVNPGGT